MCKDVFRQKEAPLAIGVSGQQSSRDASRNGTAPVSVMASASGAATATEMEDDGGRVGEQRQELVATARGQGGSGGGGESGRAGERSRIDWADI